MRVSTHNFDRFQMDGGHGASAVVQSPAMAAQVKAPPSSEGLTEVVQLLLDGGRNTVIAAWTDNNALCVSCVGANVWVAVRGSGSTADPVLQTGQRQVVVPNMVTSKATVAVGVGGDPDAIKKAVGQCSPDAALLALKADKGVLAAAVFAA
jgi:hypothetical protein